MYYRSASDEYSTHASSNADISDESDSTATATPPTSKHQRLCNPLESCYDISCNLNYVYGEKPVHPISLPQRFADRMRSMSTFVATEVPTKDRQQTIQK